MKSPFYSLDRIKKEHADYNLIIGERSNGKTTAILAEILKTHIDSDYEIQGAYIRRWEEDFKGAKGSQLFDAIVSLGWIEKWTKGKYNSVTYYGQRWFLSKYDDEGNKIAQENEPFLFGFSISSQEHYKSISFPNVKVILFDEFLTRDYYLPDEFIKFENLLSTIIRENNDVVIYMCGNTVNQYCPYFKEMGITNIKKMKKNDIDVYTYGESTLKVAVEFSDFKAQKKSNKYFAFNNPKLNMIKHGTWEIDIYPHLPCKYLTNEIVYKYYIIFEGDTLQCEIIYSRSNQFMFTFIHRKTTPIKNDDISMVYQQNIDPRPNYKRLITKPKTNIEKKIAQFFINEKVFYQDNEVGEIVRNFINWCTTEAR